MNPLRKKLHSQRGVSLLLMLLLVLVCLMAASGVLVAAAANAGKTRSNQEENQRYLAVSSALRLVCDDLESAQYFGQYTYAQEDLGQDEPDADDDGETEIQAGTTYSYQQLTGEYTCQLAKVLQDDLDWLFGRQLQQDVLALTDEDEEPRQVTLLNLPAAGGTHTLTVTPQTGTELDGDVVTVTLSLERTEPAGALTYAIQLTAELDGFQLRAELLPQQSEPGLAEDETDGVIQSGPMTWALGGITKGDGTAP
jgi:hypothetical protein